MPIHIGEISSDVTVYEGEFPLDQRQIEQLVQIVLRRLEMEQRHTRQRRADTEFYAQATAPLHDDE